MFINSNLIAEKLNEASNNAQSILNTLNKLQDQLKEINTSYPEVQKLITLPDGNSIQIMINQIVSISNAREQFEKFAIMNNSEEKIKIGDIVGGRNIKFKKYDKLAVYHEFNQSLGDNTHAKATYRIVDKLNDKFVLIPLIGRNEILMATEEQILLHFTNLTDHEKAKSHKKNGWFKMELMVNGLSNTRFLKLTSAKLFETPCSERYKSDEFFDSYNYTHSTFAVLRKRNDIFGDTLLLYFNGDFKPKYESIVLDFSVAKIGYSNKGDYFRYDGKISFFSKHISPTRAFQVDAKDRVLHILSTEQIIQSEAVKQQEKFNPNDI